MKCIHFILREYKRWSNNIVPSVTFLVQCVFQQELYKAMVSNDIPGVLFPYEECFHRLQFSGQELLHINWLVVSNMIEKSYMMDIDNSIVTFVGKISMLKDSHIFPGVWQRPTFESCTLLH
jgi:hypothetical protein